MPNKLYRLRRSGLALTIAIIGISYGLYEQFKPAPVAAPPSAQQATTEVKSDTVNKANLASAVLGTLQVKGRAPMTNYKRSQFSSGWQSFSGCDMRNRVLRRDLTDIEFVKNNNCLVASGNLNDPYTGKLINFKRGNTTSRLVQIDHVVALGNAWQTGGQQLSPSLRLQLANDPLELLAVDGPANMQKSAGDAATWLPSNKPFRCQYVARQIAVKHKYSLWLTLAEKAAMQRILSPCPNQLLPTP